jgi:hypothetical protein
MWKIALVLVLTALAILGARLAYEAPMIGARVGAAIDLLSAPAPLTPALMYAGIRG